MQCPESERDILEYIMKKAVFEYLTLKLYLKQDVWKETLSNLQNV